MKVDLLIRNGRVIDPANGIDGEYHIAIENGKIKKCYQANAILPEATQVIDASGCLVTPGLIDLHVHVFAQRTPLGLAADMVGVDQGVTTVVDAGSAGAANFGQFVSESIEQSSTQVLAWLNLSKVGLADGLAELANLEQLDVKLAEQQIERYPQWIKGIKVRMSGSVVGANGLIPLELAKQLAAKVNLPTMVHIGNAPPQLADILRLLDCGDVVTHAFHGKPGGIIQADGSLLPEAEQALARGVLFDVGHGNSSFSFHTMHRAMQLGILPHTISTDIYRHNYHGPVHSLTMTMSKLLALGMSVEQIIALTTYRPAQVLGLEQQIGNLTPGTIADITILRLQDTPIELVDSEGDVRQCGQLITPVYTIKEGKVLTCSC